MFTIFTVFLSVHAPESISVTFRPRNIASVSVYIGGALLAAVYMRSLSTPTVIERKRYSLASRHSYASFHSSYSIKLFSVFLLHVMFIEIINVDKIINAFTKNF